MRMDRDEPGSGGMEITTGERRWAGAVAYAVILAGVAALIVMLMRRFTGSLWWAIGLVTFMVSYMLVMGWLASRNMRGRS